MQSHNLLWLKCPSCSFALTKEQTQHINKFTCNNCCYAVFYSLNNVLYSDEFKIGQDLWIRCTYNSPKMIYIFNKWRGMIYHFKYDFDIKNYDQRSKAIRQYQMWEMFQ